MSQKSRMKAISQETLDICLSGSYVNPLQQKVDVTAAITQSKNGTELFTPSERTSLVLKAKKVAPARAPTVYTVVDEYSLGAAHTLLQKVGADSPICVLNFASAKNPGGGWMKGANAQEESLCRCSALGVCLDMPQVMGYYAQNKLEKDCLYTHHVIFSPLVPVFRDEHFDLISAPMTFSFVSCPAVNAKHAWQRTSDEGKIRKTMKERAEMFLAICLLRGQKNLILGCWGTGVFKNPPLVVARMFHDLLENEFKDLFDQVVISAPDPRQREIFITVFEQDGDPEKLKGVPSSYRSYFAGTQSSRGNSRGGSSGRGRGRGRGGRGARGKSRGGRSRVQR